MHIYKDTWVPTVHENTTEVVERGGKKKTVKNERVISYESVAVINNAVLKNHFSESFPIAKGEKKRVPLPELR